MIILLGKIINSDNILTMKISKKLFQFVAVLAILIGAGMPLTVNAQKKAVLPQTLYLVGTVDYDFGYDQEKPVKCFLDLRFSKGKVSGYTNYGAEYDGQANAMTGVVKARSNGTYHIDVYVTDNSGCDFDGIYNPKTGVFSGQFSGRGMTRTYPFKFKKSNRQ